MQRLKFPPPHFQELESGSFVIASTAANSAFVYSPVDAGAILPRATLQEGTMAVTTSFQTRIPYETDASDSLTRMAAHIGRLIEGVREGRQIEMRYFELSRLSRAELTRRGLHRPCGLDELMSQHVGRAPADQ
jgi:hypothetical protein